MRSTWIFEACLCTVLAGISDSQTGPPAEKYNNSLLFGPCDKPDRTPCNVRQGTIILGAVFPMHEWDYTNNTCSTVYRSESGFQRMAAFRWTVEKFGGVLSDFAENGTIGYDIRDSCSKDTNTRDEALEFINVGTNCQEEFRNKPISLVVGASSSSVSIDLTNLQSLFDVPQVSYAATTDRLNDTARFDKFVRVVPPDVYQVRAIVSLLDHFNWSYVSIVYTEDEYGKSAYDRFREESITYVGRDGFRFCLAATEMISPSADDKAYNTTLEKLIMNSTEKGWYVQAKVVIVFAQAHTATRLLKHAMNSSYHADFAQLTWIASDAWSRSIFAVKDSLNVARGLLSVEPYTDGDADEQTKEFNDRLGTMTRSDFPRHQWFVDFFREIFPDRNCMDFETDHCKNYRIEESQLYAPDGKIPFVIRSTRLAIDAIAGALRQHCGSANLTLCEAAQTTPKNSQNLAVNGTTLTKTLTNSSVAGARIGLHLVDGNRAFLDKMIPYRYSIFNLVLKQNSMRSEKVYSSYLPFRFDKIGEWQTTGNISHGVLNLTKFPIFSTGSNVPTRSECASDCGSGEKRQRPPFAQGNAGKCCWACIACQSFMYADNSSVTECKKCPATQTHNSNKTGCVDLEPIYLEADHVLAILMILLAVIGFIGTLGTAYVFVKYRATALVKASSRELSAYFLFGFIISYVMTFAFITKPSAMSCGVRRFGVGFPLSVCLSALFIKTNRISRVFNRQPGRGRPGYISPEWQLIFATLLILVQILILVVWLLVEPPESKTQVIDDNEKVQLVCTNSRSVGVAFSLSYNMLLLVCCIYYGVKTRKIPENFNEARYISFSMYTVGAVWMAFIPAYLATGTKYEAAMLALPLLLSMTALLGFLFLPKIYIILFEPDRNVKSATRRQSRTRDASRAAQSSASEARSQPSTEHRGMEMRTRDRSTNENNSTT